MYDLLSTLMERHGMTDATILAGSLTVISILCLALLLLFILVRGIAPLINKGARKTERQWHADICHMSFLRMLSILLTGALVHFLTNLWLPEKANAWQSLMSTVSYLWIIIASTGLVFTMLDAAERIYQRAPFSRQIPLRVFVQIAKLIAFLVALVMSIAALMDRSPALLVSGLGAMTAVLMLIFKDPILGFVAGVQLSANRMLSVGDWLEMPKYSANGNVIEITLTTVKVSNWDRTITTIPTYALISEAFKNWRGMMDAGGRRMMRNICIDMNSIHFLDADEIYHLRRLQLITGYIDQKQVEIEDDNRAKDVDPASPANGRHLTNIGVFRAYLVNYLQKHPGIRQDMIVMVRQLQPAGQGLPVELCAFTYDTTWVGHESVQADIFDHIFAVIPEFGLRIYQIPSGADFRALKSH